MTAPSVIEDWRSDAERDLKSTNDPGCLCERCQLSRRVIALAAVAKAADELRLYEREVERDGDSADLIAVRQAAMWRIKLDSALQALAAAGGGE